MGALSPERLELVRQITTNCVEARVPVADLRPQADGQRHVEWGGFVWELQSWITGRDGRRSSNDAISSGIALAMFHRATRTYRPRKSRDTTNDKTLRKLLDLLFPTRRMLNQLCANLSHWPKSRDQKYRTAALLPIGSKLCTVTGIQEICDSTPKAKSVAFLILMRYVQTPSSPSWQPLYSTSPFDDLGIPPLSTGLQGFGTRPDNASRQHGVLVLAGNLILAPGGCCLGS